MLQYPMNNQKLKKALKTSVFTHEEIANILKDEVSNVNAKISYMVKQGVLIRLKKGYLSFPYCKIRVKSLSLILKSEAFNFLIILSVSSWVNRFSIYKNRKIPTKPIISMPSF